MSTLRSKSSGCPFEVAPAQFTTMSKRPNRASAVEIDAVTESVSSTFVCTKAASPPAVAMLATAWLPAVSSKSAIITLA